MKLRNLFLSAIAMIVAFSACDDKIEDVIGGIPSIELVDFEGDEITFGADGGERQVTLLANRNWTIEEDASWIEVTPKSGSAAADQQTVTIKVVKNELDEDDPTAGFDREADLKFTVGAKSVYLTVKQEGPQGSTEALIVYYNNFDKEKAVKGESGWATYLDTFEGWKNATGTGLETVTYVYDRITARTNSGNGSAGGYSLYEGSGMNYLWFGSGKPYLAIQDITLPEGKVNFTVSFGAERYLSSDGDEEVDNTFNWSEFKALVSLDGAKWSTLPFEFAGKELPDGKWDLASATFKVPEGTEKLSFYFASSVESAYAIDDFRLVEALVEGVAVDFAAGEEFTPGEAEEGDQSDAAAIYSNNYDKLEAKKTYGSSGDSWPYLDQFDGWMNHAGTGAENVTYSYKGMSVRANSYSNSGYSDYEGSGLNNMFFGSNAYLSTNNIALNGATTLTLTFGTEKYSQENGSVFTNSEYHIWLSNDGGAKWVELTDYTFAGGTTEGRWNVATANFTVPSGTETLSICMQVDVASAYRLDDFKLAAGTVAGTAVDFSQAVEKDFAAGNPAGGDDSDATAIYSNNYDKQEATKTYGSNGGSWPYLDQFDGWMNHAGTGAENVTYSYKGMSARANSTSDGTFSDYDGSGLNNMFFGSNAYLSTNNIALNGATTLTLTFGTEKYSQENGSVFTNSEYHIWLSNDGGAKWVELTDYTFAGGTTEGRWNVATANFTVPSGTETLSICMQVDVASSYRLDDFKLAAGTVAGTTVDFSQAVEKDFAAGGSTGGGTTTVPESKGQKTVEEFIAAADTQNYYELTGTVSGFNSKYCSFDLTDATGKIYVYSVLSASKSEWADKISNGGTVTIYGKYEYYAQKSQHEVVDAYIVSFTSDGGGNEGGETDVDAIYANDYDKQEATKTYGSGSSYPYLDQFDGWMNHAGTGSENVTYSYKGVSVRSNSTSDSSYSDYAGSGLNNIFFGSNAYFSTNNIVLNGATTLTLTFGTEKFSYDNGSVFTNSEYHIWLSNDGGAKWVELTDYTFAGGTTEGRWNVATANFTVPSGTETLSICMQVDVASSYRLDDFKLAAGTVAGTTVDFSQAVEKDFAAGGSTGGGTTTVPESKGQKTVEEFIAAADTQNYYELTGTVSGFNSKYCSFDLTDATGKIYVYSVLSASKSEWADKISNGGTVTIYGKYEYYAQKSQHEVVDAYIVSFTSDGGGNEGGEEPEPEDPSEIQTVTVAEFNAKPVSTSVLYRLTGTVGGPINTKYGNFDLIDETGKVYVYGISNWSDYSATFAEGGTVTVVGQRGDYNGKIEVLEGYIESYTAPAGGGDDSGETPEDPVTPPAGGEVTGTVLTISRETMTGFEWTTNSYGSQNISDLSTYLSWEINGVGFIGAKMCIPQSSNVFSAFAIQCQGNTDAAKQSRFGNTTSVGKIKKITVISHNERYTPNFNLALGTEQVVGVAVPSSMVAAADMTTTQEGTTYTTVYVPTEDVGFFAIYKNTTGALYFSEVIVEYEATK